MSSHNPKAESVVVPETVNIVSEREDVRAINSHPSTSDEISIAEDDDAGTDPYNSTGQHVIIKSRLQQVD